MVPCLLLLLGALAVNTDEEPGERGAATTVAARAGATQSTAHAKSHANHNEHTNATSFKFEVDWSSGGTATTLPIANFSVCKLEAVFYPPDGKTYAYVDVVSFSDRYYPASYSSEVGVFSSPDGRTGWEYHGIVIRRGKNGSWDGGGIASPGAAVADDGSVVVGYAAENSPSGGANRGIGIAIAPHPLGPFAKQATPLASPTGLCGGTGRCDDVIMQSWLVNLAYAEPRALPAPALERISLVLWARRGHWPVDGQSADVISAGAAACAVPSSRRPDFLNPRFCFVSACAQRSDAAVCIRQARGRLQAWGGPHLPLGQGQLQCQRQRDPAPGLPGWGQDLGGQRACAHHWAAARHRPC